MTFQDIKAAVVVAWALVWSVVAVALATSLSNWVLLVGSGVLPPLMVLWLWHPPAPVVLARIRPSHR